MLAVPLVERLIRSADPEVAGGAVMPTQGDRRLGLVFGVVGSVLIVLDGLLRVIVGVVLIAFGHGLRAIGTWDQALVLIAVGLITGFFSRYGRSGGKDQGLTAGVVLIVLAVIGWFALGWGSEVLALLGAILVLIGGILFLVSGR